MDKPGHIAAQLLAAALVLTALATPTLAQSARWYQIEVMVFTQPAGAAEEQWPIEPTLEYPDNFQLLIPRSALPLETPASENEARLEAERKRELQTDSTESTGSEDDATEWLLPTPFALLPQSSSEFASKTAYMRRAGGYRILFHEIWAQPVRARSEIRALVIDRSLEGDEWPELQGSIKLWLSRYLHVETNLWLNTQAEYLSSDWRMPAPPRAPGSKEETLALDESAAAPSGNGALLDARTLNGSALFDDSALVDETGRTENAYPYRHAVVLQQARRMRSNEVHYIDHPLLGMVVKFTPLDEEQLHALALEEQR